ncbi:hypothetical protein GvMRE_IIg151 [endosymbiont GvMRE of Glomus versiforme]|nr:hypothetical protein GvMRE_IIg151 [endosymbiont GvMRE of Glomus versiforme]
MYLTSLSMAKRKVKSDCFFAKEAPFGTFLLQKEETLKKYSDWICY